MGVFALLGALIACSQLPQDTLESGAGGDPRRYEQLVSEAREAFDRSPRSVAQVQVSAQRFGEALAMRSDDYETLWQAARTAAWLGEYGGDNTLREEHVRRGLTFANTALQLKPEGVEANFYHAVLAGFMGDLDNSYGLDAVKQIEQRMTRLIEAGANVAHGGPQRVYGVLLLRAPGPPTSVGSLRNAKKQLERAVEIAPHWPENHLYLAELEFAWAKDKGKPEFAKQARERLEEHLIGPEAKAPEGHDYEFGVWQSRARKLVGG
jgi:hypothetical protein